MKDIKQDFTDWENEFQTGNATYVAIAKDARGNEIYGWLGSANGIDGEEVNIFPTQDEWLTQGWMTNFGPTSSFVAWAEGSSYVKGNADSIPAVVASVVENEGSIYVAISDSTGSVLLNEPGSGRDWTSYWAIIFENADVDADITYEIKRSVVSLSQPFETTVIPAPLRKGSDGSLFKSDGNLNTDPITLANPFNAELGLQQAYSGLLSSPDYGGGCPRYFASFLKF